MTEQGETVCAQRGAGAVALAVATRLYVGATCLLVACGGGGPEVDGSVPEDAGAVDGGPVDASTPTDGDLSDADSNTLRVSFWQSAEIWHAGTTLNLEARVTGGTPPYDYVWTPGGLYPENSLDMFRREDELGVYETCVEVSDSAGATVSDCLTLEVFPSPIATIGDLPAEICVQDSPILITLQDNLVEGTAPNTRVLARRPIPGERLPLVYDPVSPFTWNVDDTHIGQWQIAYDVRDRSGVYSFVTETINIIDCP